jgi:hypothetical protein
MRSGADAVNSMDLVIAEYRKDVDRTLLDECLKRTVEERIQALEEFNEFIGELRAALNVSTCCTKFGELLRTLAAANIDFILVGGVAAAAHGSARSTQDIDVVYRRGEDNLHALLAAIGPLNPTLRGAPAGLPFHFDLNTLTAGLNFTLTTTSGWLNLAGEITGGGTYETLLPHSKCIKAFGVSFHLISLDELIRVKRAAGRPKDFESIAELESVRDSMPPQRAQ